MFCSGCGNRSEECKCEGRSRSRERKRLEVEASKAKGSLEGFDMAALAIALKPIIKEAVREEVTDRIADLELRVDKADESIEGLNRIEPRVVKLETDVQDLKRRVENLEAVSKGQEPDGQAPRGVKFIPSFIEVKGFCSWDDRREKGLTRENVKRTCDEVKALLPEDLKQHFHDFVLNGLSSFKIKVNVTPGHAYDIKASLNDIFQQGQYKINGVKPYTVTERTPEAQRKFATFGKAVEAVKLANRDRKAEQEVVIEPRYLSIFVKTNAEGDPKFIAEVGKDGRLEWNDANCQSLLGKSGKELEDAGGSRR